MSQSQPHSEQYIFINFFRISSTKFDKAIA